MPLIKDILIKETGLTEGEIRERLDKNIPLDSHNRQQADLAAAGQNAIKRDSWAYTCMLYAPSSNTITDRMLAVLVKQDKEKEDAGKSING